MKIFDYGFNEKFKNHMKSRKPDFNNVLKVLKKEVPSRYTLFEMFRNDELEQKLAGYDNMPQSSFFNLKTLPETIDNYKMRIKAWHATGYDYCTIHSSNFKFNNNMSTHGKESRSMNEGSVIHSREDLENYIWANPDDSNNSIIKSVEQYLPDGMKFIVMGPGGVLENVIELVGYEQLCFLLIDDPELVMDIFDNVGSRFVRYYELALENDSVGACIANDDWGFNTQTMFAVPDMQKYVFKWHKKIVETIHKHNRPAILHSCGNLKNVFDDIIDDIKYDGKHSYEDNILNVESAYDILNPRIAVLGGMDLDYVCRSTPQDVYNRSLAMLEKTQSKGGYALGTGNSVPNYVPDENYFAMISAAILNS